MIFAKNLKYKMNSDNFGVVTIAVKDNYRELAINLAKSCKIFDVPVTVLTDKKTNNSIFDKEIEINVSNYNPEEIWLIKRKIIPMIENYNVACFIGADSLMFNNYLPCIEALEGRGIIQPNETYLSETNNWAFKRPARSVAIDYGISLDVKMPRINGDFFCWRVGHPESYQWAREFDDALIFMKKNELGIRDESAMFLTHLKMGLSQKDYYNTMSCLWTTHDRKYDDDWKQFSCKNEFGIEIFPTFGHYGSCHTKRIESNAFTYEYPERVKVLHNIIK